MIDVDSFSTELTQELAFSPLEKMLPPRLRYRYYKWLKQFRNMQTPGRVPVKEVHKSVNRAFEHISALKELKKNEVMTSFYDNGAIRMDFGGDVDQKVKDAAMRWAKKKGLRASEASLDKSDGSPSYTVYSTEGQSAKGICVKYAKYSHE
jgi:hypothetical protein